MSILVLTRIEVKSLLYQSISAPYYEARNATLYVVDGLASNGPSSVMTNMNDPQGLNTNTGPVQPQPPFLLHAHVPSRVAVPPTRFNDRFVVAQAALAVEAINQHSARQV